MIQAKKLLPKSSWLSAKVFMVSLICTMFVAVLTGLTTVSNTVTIHEGGYAYTRYTIYTEIADILEQEQISIAKDDTCRFTGFDDHHADVYITRAFDVKVTADGASRTVSMSDGTVKDALEKADVTISEDDLVNVSLSENVTENTDIQVRRVTFEERKEKQPIPFDVIEATGKPSPHGRIDVVKKGVKGEKLVTKKVRFIDGRETDFEVLSEKTTKKPVSQKMGVIETIYIGGEKVDFLADDVPVELDANGIPKNYRYKVTGKATAYSALGRPTSLRPGDVAMNLNKFPRGTRLYIRSVDGSYVYGYSTVRDTGIAVNDGRVLVDCYFVTYAESCRFGAKRVEVYVLN